MPQVLSRPFLTRKITLHASSAGYPTAVVLPRGCDVVLIHPISNAAEWTWDSTEGADIGAQVFPAVAGAALSIPVPPAPDPDRKRHVVSIDIGTALADGETITLSDDGGTTNEIYEADPSNDGIGGGSTAEIGTNAATAADQAAGLAAAINAGALDLYAHVDLIDTTVVHVMGKTATATVSVTLTASTGTLTTTDHGTGRPILYIASDTTSTVVHVATAAG